MTIFTKLKIADIKEEIKKLESINNRSSLQETELKLLKQFELKEENKSMKLNIHFKF